MKSNEHIGLADPQPITVSPSGVEDSPATAPSSGTDETARLSNGTSVAVDSLKPHPLSVEIYGDEPDTAFIENVRSRGIIEPLIVTEDNEILAGDWRWQAALKAGLKEVPVRRVGITNKIDEERLILDSNRQREKTVEQRLREFAHYLAIEEKDASARRGQRTDLGKNSSTSPPGRARDLAARRVGLSGAHAEKGLKVLRELDARRDSKDDALSGKIRDVLNQSGIQAAHREVFDAGWITKAAATGDGASHPRASQPPQASAATISQPQEEEGSVRAPSVVKRDLLTQIQREAVRDLEGLDGAQLRQFLADLCAFKSTWLNKREGVSHD
jgi:ParB-like chromosome segregation protein Spo0J